MSNPVREFDLDDLVTCHAEFRNVDGDLVDPAAVAFKFKNPAGATVTYVYNTDVQLVRAEAGKYHVAVNANLPGWWYYKFSSTGVSQAAAERSFRVLSSQF